jgi:membrane protein YqaA with SNARE-associated domain
LGVRSLAIDFLNQLLADFEKLGPWGLIGFLFIVFFLDAMLIPTLPELFVMAFFARDPTLGWGLLILTVVCTAEVAANGTLYLIVKRFGVPKVLEKTMHKWMEFLVVKDERLILVNRAIPLVPLMGAFIATMKWDPRKSMLYVLVGALVKYSLLILLVNLLYQFFAGNAARDLTLIAIAVVVGVSWVQGHRAKRQHLGPVAKRLAHLGEHSSRAAPAPGVDDGKEGDAGGGNANQQPEQS